MDIEYHPPQEIQKKCILENQDHTLGNLLTETFLQDPHVVFAAYKQIHPLTKKIEIQLQTDGKDVKKVIEEAKDKINAECDQFLEILEEKGVQ